MKSAQAPMVQHSCSCDEVTEAESTPTPCFNLRYIFYHYCSKSFVPWLLVNYHQFISVGLGTLRYARLLVPRSSNDNVSTASTILYSIIAARKGYVQSHYFPAPPALPWSVSPLISISRCQKQTNTNGVGCFDSSTALSTFHHFPHSMTCFDLRNSDLLQVNVGPQSNVLGITRYRNIN